MWYTTWRLAHSAPRPWSLATVITPRIEFACGNFIQEHVEPLLDDRFILGIKLLKILEGFANDINGLTVSWAILLWQPWHGWRKVLGKPQEERTFYPSDSPHWSGPDHDEYCYYYLDHQKFGFYHRSFDDGNMDTSDDNDDRCIHPKSKNSWVF